MEMVGPKKQAIYQRYAVTDEVIRKDAARQRERLDSEDIPSRDGRAAAISWIFTSRI